MDLDLKRVLSKLSKSRPVFHSEADFQFALAWELKTFYKQSNMRLEYPVVLFGKKAYIDIWLEIQNKIFPIELKYKTINTTFESEGEIFTLKNHSAEDLGRLHYLKDIERIENLKFRHLGYSILLSNANKYWSQPRRLDTRDADFRIHEGRRITGKLVWGTEEKPFPANEITLDGSYTMCWEDYSSFEGNEHGCFRYLIQEI